MAHFIHVNHQRIVSLSCLVHEECSLDQDYIIYQHVQPNCTCTKMQKIEWKSAAHSVSGMVKIYEEIHDGIINEKKCAVHVHFYETIN